MSALATIKSKPNYGVESISAAYTPIQRHAGLELGPPVGVAGCATCGERLQDSTGHWINKLKNNVAWCGNPKCLCCECGNVLGESYLVTNKMSKVCGAKKCRLRVAAREKS